jgi:hypothetical protein
MNSDDSTDTPPPRIGFKKSLKRITRNQSSIGFDIDERYIGPAVQRRVRARDECYGWHNHNVTRPDPHRSHAEVKGSRAGIHGHTVQCAQLATERCLELSNGRPLREPIPPQYTRDGFDVVVCDALVPIWNG